MRKTLEVIGKPLSYGTRRLIAGDEFTASARDAKLLLKMKRAREVRPREPLPPPPPELLAKVADISALRAEYEAKMGKRPFMGWDAAELRRRMEQAA